MNFRFLAGAILILVMTVGCGPASDMGFVSGVVTLNGEPVGYTEVIFHPASGRASIGYTDENGNYELSQTRDRQGALIGEHKITLAQDLEAEKARGITIVKRDIPKKYGDKEKTDLTRTVEGGSNTINLELKSE